MEEGETRSIDSRKELRKQKLMEYLKAKGKFKEPDSKSIRQNAFQMNKITASSLKGVGKENKTSKCLDNEHENFPVTVQPTVGPAKKVFGVSNKDNVKSILQPGSHSAKHLSADNKPSGSAFSKTIAKTPKGTFGCRPASTCPVSSRISLGPLVKTKTGLVPAATQPRQSRLPTSVREIGATKAVVNKFATRDSTSVTASKPSSSLAYKKKLAPAFKSSGEERKSSMAGAKIKVQGQNKARSNLQLDKSTGPSKSQHSNQQKSTSNLHKCTNAANCHKEKLSKCNKSAPQPTNGSKNPKPPLKVGQNGQLHTVPSQASRTGGVHRPKDERAPKNTVSTKKDDKVGWGPANVQQQRRPRVAKPAQTVSFANQTRSTKVKLPDTRNPPTDGKKQTAAQAERIKKLQEWREAKGISYKRPPMPLKPQAKRTAPVFKSFWPIMKEEDEAHSLICAVDRSLDDCIQLLREGCPPEQVKAVLTRLPAVSRKFVKYWICQARLMEWEGNLDVLPLFEEAVSIVLEPVDELRTVVFEILKRKDEDQVSSGAGDKEGGDLPAVEKTPEFNKDPLMTPKPVRALICGEKGESSVVKYKITATPGHPPSQQKEPIRVNGQEVRFFTPVRRSVRIERVSLRYPVSLQEHDLCVASYNDLISMEDKERIEEEPAGEISPSANSSPMYVYRENEALKDKVFVKLVCEEDA